MRRVVEFSIKQTVFLNVVFVILVVAGVYSMFTTPVENMPTVDMGQVFIDTTYYGASAKDVEQLVTVKIEDAIDGLENVEYVQSNSYRNSSSVKVKFIDDIDYKDKYDELRFRVLNIKDELPAEAEDPVFTYIDTHKWIPVIQVNIAGDIPQRSLKWLAEELKDHLIAIPNVRNVELIGEFTPEFHVSIDPEKLRQYGITFSQVSSAIHSANTKIPTGSFKKVTTEYMLDAGSRLDSQQEVLDVLVRRDGDGNFIRVSDLVTNARMYHREPALIHSVNGEDNLQLKVIKEEKGNSVDIAEQVKAVSRKFEEMHKNENIRIVFSNDSTFEINDSVKTLGGNLLIGMIFVLLVLYFTLGLRNAMLTAIGIPFAFLCSIIIMKISGVSINTISLFAFVLVTGIMVDDAVIIMENIFRHFQMGKPIKKAVIDGTGEVMLPVISSAITTMLAFLPMLIMSGSTGDFFAVIPKTVTFALIASLIEALFILPIHILDWGPKKLKNTGASHEGDNAFKHLEKGIFAFFWKIYRGIVTFLLNHKIITFGSIISLFMVSMIVLILSVTGIMPLIKVKFFPGNYFRYHVTAAMPVGTTVEETDKLMRGISEHIMSFGKEQAHSANATAGFYEDIDYTWHMGHRYGQVVVTLPEDKDRNFPENPSDDPMQHLEFIRKKISEYVKNQYQPKGFIPQIKIFEEADGPPTGKPVNIRVTSITMESAVEAADVLKTYLKTDKEFADLMDLDDDRPVYQSVARYTPRQDAVFEYSLNSGEVTALVASALNGYQAGKFRALDEEVDLLVRVARSYDPGNENNVGMSGPEDVLDIPVIEHSASPILLRDLVNLEYKEEASSRSRYKGRPTITITSDIKSDSKLSPARVQFLVNDYFMKHPSAFSGVSISFGGEFDATSRSYASLTFAFFIAVLAIYMVLSSQFNDYFQPMIIISAVPFALIGVIMGLFLSRTTFTIGSFLAIVGLAGVAVNDSLLLIDFMNVRLRAGKPLRQSIIESCAARMRPVLITTVTTMLGLLPMAIGIPKKSIAWAPMATAFVAGLSSATILALLIVPVEYEFFEQVKSWFKGKKIRPETDSVYSLQAESTDEFVSADEDEKKILDET